MWEEKQVFSRVTVTLFGMRVLCDFAVSIVKKVKKNAKIASLKWCLNALKIDFPFE